MNELAKYDEFESLMSEVELECNFIPAADSKEGYDKSKRVSLDVGKVLKRLEDSRKDKKADSLAIGRAIDAGAKLIRERLEEIQEPHKLAYKAVDDAVKAKAKAWTDELHLRVEAIRALPELLRDSDSEAIAAASTELEQNECLDFYELTSDALLARKSSKDQLTVMFIGALKSEAQTEELEKYRKDNAERLKKEAGEASVKFENDRIEKDRADREMDLNHRHSIRSEAILALLQIHGVDRDTADEIFSAIDSNSIPHIEVKY